MRADLAAFYEGTRTYSPAVAARRASQEAERRSRSPIPQTFQSHALLSMTANPRKAFQCVAIALLAP